MDSQKPSFHFSIFTFQFVLVSRRTLFSLFNLYWSLGEHPFQLSLFNLYCSFGEHSFLFFCGFYELILLLFHHSYAAFVKGFLLIFSMVEKSVLLGLMRFIPSLYSSNNSLPTNFSASTSNVSI